LRTTVEIRTLDEIIASSNLPIPEMVKIDAEGLDLEVLASACGLIGKTEIFFIEAAARGNGENTVFEVVRRMAERGYDLLDVTHLNRSPK
jgi:Methyltransferase FkbM domain